MSVKVCSACFVYWGKKLFVRYFGITISVNELNKSRGFEMHWVGGGVKVLKRDDTPHIMFEPVRVLLFFFSPSLILYRQKARFMSVS